MPEPSQERIEEWVAGAKSVLSDDLPAGHKLWKSWALDLADQVLALAKFAGTEQPPGALLVTWDLATWLALAVLLCIAWLLYKAAMRW